MSPQMQKPDDFWFFFKKPPYSTLRQDNACVRPSIAVMIPCCVRGLTGTNSTLQNGMNENE